MKLLLTTLIGCLATTPEEPDAIQSADTALIDTQVNDPIEIDSGDLNLLTGTTPDQALEAPEFSATNYDGSPRKRADLLGKATVIWFYPLAKTPG